MPKSNRGFTIVETLVAILIMSVSITSAMVLVQTGLRTTFNARDQITAFYLAQDALEQIHSIHFTNRLAEPVNLSDPDLGDSNYWLKGLDDAVPGGSIDPLCISDDASASCKINNFKDFVSSGGNYNFEILPCTVTPCDEPLQYIPADGVYGYFASDPSVVTTSFVRDITIKTPLPFPGVCNNGGTPVIPGNFNDVPYNPCSPNPDSAEVKVTVSWRALGTIKKVTLIEYMNNY
jgi:prepilin-type N-terminal cleavage/methylation domain-containing protein